MAARSAIPDSRLVRVLHRLLCDGAPPAVEAEAAWRRYFSGCGFPVGQAEASDAECFGIDSAQSAGLTFAAQSAAHVWVALGAARRAEHHVPGLDGRQLLEPLLTCQGARFRQAMLDLLDGRHLREAGLGAVLESALFRWVGRCSSRDLHQALQEAVSASLQRDWTSAELAQLYLRLSPLSFRRALGEHYTPAWLVDLVLERVDFDASTDSVLDPTCGAGVFLARAMARIRVASPRRGRPLVREILRRVRGIELNPLAVSLSRLAFLDGLGPSLCGTLATLGATVPVVLGDALFGPRDAAAPPRSPGGSWPRVEPVTLLVGNPPWLNWERLAPSYREAIRDHPAGLSAALFPHRGLRARSGGAHDDLAGLIAYGAADRFLADGGRLGLVLPVSLLRSRRGGEGFRSLRLADRFQLQVRSVDDLTRLKPFPGAAGRAAVLAATRGAATRFPVAWTSWSGGGRAPGVQEDLAALRDRARPADLCAEPVEPGAPTSPWLVGTPRQLTALRRMAGPSPYRARKGVDTSLNAVFWVEVLGREDGLVRVRNAQTRSRAQVEPAEALVEPGALFPLLRGRDLGRWTAAPRYHQVLLYDPVTGRPLPEAVARERFPRARSYLRRYEPLLLKRRIYAKYLESQPPYACYDIGPYSFAGTKVVWKALAAGIQACVVDSLDGAVVVPDHNVVLVPLADPDEAHYLCGVLNSSQATLFADAYTGWFYSTHLLQCFAVPQYNPRSRRQGLIARFSRQAHGLPKPGAQPGARPGAQAARQTQLDELVGRLDGFAMVPDGDLP